MYSLFFPLFFVCLFLLLSRRLLGAQERLLLLCVFIERFLYYSFVSLVLLLLKDFFFFQGFDLRYRQSFIFSLVYLAIGVVYLIKMHKDSRFLGSLSLFFIAVGYFFLFLMQTPSHEIVGSLIGKENFFTYHFIQDSFSVTVQHNPLSIIFFYISVPFLITGFSVGRVAILDLFSSSISNSNKDREYKIYYGALNIGALFGVYIAVFLYRAIGSYVFLILCIFATLASIVCCRAYRSFIIRFYKGGLSILLLVLFSVALFFFLHNISFGQHFVLFITLFVVTHFFCFYYRYLAFLDSFFSVLLLFISSCFFWAFFGQYHTMVLFAEKHVSQSSFIDPAQVNVLNLIYMIIFTCIYMFFVCLRKAKQSPKKAISVSDYCFFIPAFSFFVMACAYLSIYVCTGNSRMVIPFYCLHIFYFFYSLAEFIFAASSINTFLRFFPKEQKFHCTGIWFISVSIAQRISIYISDISSSNRISGQIADSVVSMGFFRDFFLFSFFCLFILSIIFFIVYFLRLYALSSDK